MIEDQYIGCYRTSHRSTDDVVTSVNMAIDVCTTLCRQLKRTYASLQVGRHDQNWGGGGGMYEQ